MAQINTDMNYNCYFRFLQFSLRLYDGEDILSGEALKGFDWKDFWQFAKKQALTGVVFEGIQRLPKEYAPNPSTLMTWLGQSQNIYRRNLALNKASAYIYNKVKAEGFRCCILKGQGNALMYPNPHSRIPGDVDVWVRANREELRELAHSLVDGNGIVGKESLNHIELTLNGVAVELHSTPAIMNNPVYNHRLQKWLERNADLQCSNIVSLPDGAGEMATPTASFNAIYQLCHLYHHLFDEGIGLRQIIDYYYVLTNMESSWRTDITEKPSAELKRNLNRTDSPSEFRINSADNMKSAELKRNLNGKDSPSEFRINSADNMKSAELRRNLNGTPGRRMEEANTDYSALQQDLKRLGLWKFASAVMWVLHEVLGLSEDKMIAPMDEKRGRLLLDEILDGGNFGQYGSQQHFGRGTIGHNVQRLRRDLRLVRLYPAEALAEPFFRVWHFFWRFSRR